MTRTEFDRFCATLPATSHVVQWGGASVWKVGGKIFAICSRWNEEDKDRISFKCSDLSYAMLLQQQGFRPSPYLARAKWVQMTEPAALEQADIELYLTTAHQLVAKKLSRKRQAELGLAENITP